MIEVKIPDSALSWDRYNDFHCRVDKHGFARTSNYGESPVILFETGELIITQPVPDPGLRGWYALIGVTLATSKDTTLWMPGVEEPITLAWLDDGGMQYLLCDDETKRVVRIDGPHRYSPQASGTAHQKAGSPITFGVPKRFQYNSRAYIPGPGLPPVSHEKLRVSIPVPKAGYTPEQREHIHMIVATGQAAMKLTDHPAVRARATLGANPDVLLKCTTWQDVPDALLPGLASVGAGRVIREFDYLLTEPRL